MFTPEFIEDHNRRCDASDKDPKLLEQVDAALAAIQASGRERVAIDLEGVLVSTTFADVKKRFPQIRRKGANAVLRLMHDRFQRKSKIWTAAGGTHIDDVFDHSSLKKPEGMGIFDIYHYMGRIESPRDFLRKSDKKSYEPTHTEEEIDKLIPDQRFIKKCCEYIAVNHGGERLLNYCGLPSDADLGELLDFNKQETLARFGLKSLSGIKKMEEWSAFLWESIYDYQIKFPHLLDVHLLLDDNGPLHRAAAVLLGHELSARAVCNVSSLRIIPAGNDQPLEYRVGRDIYDTADEYFENDNGLVDALNNAAAGRHI